MELDQDNDPSLTEEEENEEEMETQPMHRKKKFKTRGVLQLTNKSAKKSFTNGRNAYPDTSSESETDEAPDENSNVLLKRDQNIKENKAVVRTNSAFLDGINSQENKEMSCHICNSNCLFYFIKHIFVSNKGKLIGF